MPSAHSRSQRQSAPGARTEFLRHGEAEGAIDVHVEEREINMVHLCKLLGFRQGGRDEDLGIHVRE